MKFSTCVFSILFCFLSVHSQNSNIDQADDLYSSGNYTKAVKAYKNLENKDEVYDKIAKAYMALGNYGEALKFYKKSTEANPESKLIQYEFAKLLSKVKKYNEAKDLFNALILKDSLNPNYHYELGIVLEKEKNPVALEKFKTTFNLDSTHQKAIFKIAKHYIFKRKFELAHQIIDIGLDSYSENIELISLKAQTYYYQEYYTHSAVWFKKLIDLGEESEFIHEKLSISYAENYEYENAIYHRKQVLRFNPNDANTLFVIGSYYEKLSDFDKAAEYMEKSLSLQDQPLDNEYAKLARVYNSQKKYKLAIEAFQKALKENPSNLATEFFLIRTKEEYYADLDTKINLYENYIKKYKDVRTPYVDFAKVRLKDLKEEKFLKSEE